MSDHRPDPRPSHHETRDISLRAVMAGGLAIGLAVGGLVMVADVLFEVEPENWTGC